MKKVKIISSTNDNDLTTKVNEFLATVDNSKVQISLSECETALTCMIVYEEGPISNVARGLEWFLNQVLAEVQKHPERIPDRKEPEDYIEEEMAMLLKHYLLGLPPLYSVECLI